MDVCVVVDSSLQLLAKEAVRRRKFTLIYSDGLATDMKNRELKLFSFNSKQPSASAPSMHRQKSTVRCCRIVDKEKTVFA
jgi:hypothetical protein